MTDRRELHEFVRAVNRHTSNSIAHKSGAWRYGVVASIAPTMVLLDGDPDSQPIAAHPKGWCAEVGDRVYCHLLRRELLVTEVIWTGTPWDPLAHDPGLIVPLMAVFSLPGLIPASTALSGAWPLMESVAAAGVILTATLAVADSSGDALAVGYYLNSSLLGSVTIPSGAQTATTSLVVRDWGNAGDVVQVEVSSYGGTTASELVAVVFAR